MMRFLSWAALIAVLSLSSITPVAAQDAELPQAWEGEFTANGIPVGFTLRFADDGTGEIDIPMQNAMELPLSEIAVGAAEITFVLAIEGMPPEAASSWTLNVADDGQSASGTLVQAGATVPVTATRVAMEDASLHRPQTPEPPFPYVTRDVTFTNEAAGATLAGTVTIPEGDGPHPGVVLISGSGPQDRDEMIFGHRPFLVLADHLTRNGFAVLRYDDRGVAESTGGELANATTLDFADDAQAGLEFLAAQSEVDATRVGLIGHSEGGIIAPIVASRSDDVAFIVLLAGTGVPGRDLLIRQQHDLFAAEDVDSALLDELSAAVPTMYDTMISGDTEGFETALREVVRLQLQLGGMPADDGTVEAMVAQSRGTFELPWMRTFIELDPATYLAQVSCPVLAINGTLDLQVAYDVNLPAIESAVQSGGNTDVTTVTLDNLNHLFQPATTGSIEEYAEIELTFDEGALNAVSAWLSERAGLE